MPELDLSDLPDLSYKCAEQAYIRLLAVMYLPGDEPDDVKRRKKVEAAARAFVVIKAVSHLSAYTPDNRIDFRRLMTAMADVAGAPTWPEMLHIMADSGVRRGDISRGKNVAQIFGRVLLNRHSVDRAKREWSSEAGKLGLKGYGEGTLTKDWADFRSVAHIWLAHLTSVGAPPRHVSPEEMLGILSLADALRLEGEAYTTGNRAVPLLDPASVWRFRLPSGVALEPIQVVWRRG